MSCDCSTVFDLVVKYYSTEWTHLNSICKTICDVVNTKRTKEILSTTAAEKRVWKKGKFINDRVCVLPSDRIEFIFPTAGAVLYFRVSKGIMLTKS